MFVASVGLAHRGWSAGVYPTARCPATRPLDERKALCRDLPVYERTHARGSSWPGMTACWMLSVRLVPGWKRDGWRALLKSVYGFVWLDFGLDIVLRFSMLAYNAVEWGNGTLRLVAQPIADGEQRAGILRTVLAAAGAGLRGRGAPSRSRTAGAGAHVHAWSLPMRRPSRLRCWLPSSSI